MLEVTDPETVTKEERTWARRYSCIVHKNCKVARADIGYVFGSGHGTPATRLRKLVLAFLLFLLLFRKTLCATSVPGDPTGHFVGK